MARRESFLAHHGRGDQVVDVGGRNEFGAVELLPSGPPTTDTNDQLTESLSNELELFNIRARLVEPGLAPTTNFAANGGPRMQGLIPAEYGAFAQSFFAKMANYPTAYCTEAEVAEATFAAATEDGRRLRYPAGPDSKLTSTLRWTTSEDHYLSKMRELFGPGLPADAAAK